MTNVAILLDNNKYKDLKKVLMYGVKSASKVHCVRDVEQDDTSLSKRTLRCKCRRWGHASRRSRQHTDRSRMQNVVERAEDGSQEHTSRSRAQNVVERAEDGCRQHTNRSRAQNVVEQAKDGSRQHTNQSRAQNVVEQAEDGSRQHTDQSRAQDAVERAEDELRLGFPSHSVLTIQAG